MCHRAEKKHIARMEYSCTYRNASRAEPAVLRVHVDAKCLGGKDQRLACQVPMPRMALRRSRTSWLVPNETNPQVLANRETASISTMYLT